MGYNKFRGAGRFRDGADGAFSGCDGEKIGRMSSWMWEFDVADFASNYRWGLFFFWVVINFGVEGFRVGLMRFSV